MRLVLVCDSCGAVQGELGAFDYKPHPALPPGLGDPSAPDSGPSAAAA